MNTTKITVIKTNRNRETIVRQTIEEVVETIK